MSARGIPTALLCTLLLLASATRPGVGTYGIRWPHRSPVIDCRATSHGTYPC